MQHWENNFTREHVLQELARARIRIAAKRSRARPEPSKSNTDYDREEVGRLLPSRRAAGLPAASAPAKAKAGATSGTDQTDSQGRPGAAAQTTAHRQAAVGTVAGRRVYWGLYRGQRRGARRLFASGRRLAQERVGWDFLKSQS